MSAQRRREKSEQGRLAAQWVVGVVVCLAANLLVAHAIFESAVGTVFILDDSPPEGSLTVPFLVGAALGLFLACIFTVRIAVTAAVVGLFAGPLLGTWWWIMLITVLAMAVGGALGWAAAACLPAALRPSRAVSIFGLAVLSVGAVASLVTA